MLLEVPPPAIVDTGEVNSVVPDLMYWSNSCNVDPSTRLAPEQTSGRLPVFWRAKRGNRLAESGVATIGPYPTRCPRPGCRRTGAAWDLGAARGLAADLNVAPSVALTVGG